MDALLRDSGFNSEMKLELFTMGRNSLLMRVENIADTFNTNGVVVFQAVDINKLTNGLFTLMNGDLSVDVKITELTTSGNMPLEEMAASKIQWSTADDDVVTRSVRASKDTMDVIELQQQRIRVFSVTYTPLNGEFLQ